ncbi:uncharacterized protein [Apostichopus japonicus]|uniref:uncharacterized protein isoform X2 n=1 Tax=Stichopus japonicus TaxID=307972 RepID=UPI003AB27122
MELNPDLQEKKIFLIEGLKRTYKVQYDAIQPLPYVKDRLYCVDKVFVEGGFEVCLAPELTRGTRGSWERLESYKSIYTDLRFKSKRRIIQGEPGYGKSTLTLQLAYDWCNDVSNSPINNVEILILLRLRQLGSTNSLFRAIKSFLLFQEPRVKQHEIAKIIHSCSSVHIILDGYDEYPGRDSNDNDDVHRIIKMELFADFDVSLTTRYLPESLRQETKRAKLTGFDDKAKDEYIRKAVVGNNDEAVEKIKQRLYENSILSDLCQVPLIFVMFAHMAHDQRDFMKFKSVTQFFKHIFRCFYEHLKQKFKDNRNNVIYLHAMEHHELDKIAFEGLNKENQQLSWIKTEFCERVGPESYHQYILIGILVEEDVVSDDSTVDNVLFTTEVRFYHKLFCEWYAAHHLVTLLKNAYDINETLRFLDPVDLQYLFRFACGLDPDAGKILINHLKRLPGGDTFAILCILEQTGDVKEIMDSVKELCSRDVKIKRGDSALLQRSTTQLLEIASNNDIPISCLHLEYSSIKFEGDTIILHSRIPLPILPTLEKMHIAGSNAKDGDTETLPGIVSYRNIFRRLGDAQSANQETLTEKDILNLFRYGMKCRHIKELMSSQLQLPASVTPEAITQIMKSRNIRVRWRPFDIDFHLDLQNGHWEVDDIQVLENIRCSTVSIDGENSKLQQRSTVQLLHVAHRHNIPICSLLFSKSFKTVDNGTIILNNGIQLTKLPPLQKIHDVDNNRCNAITDQDIANILLCVIKGQHFNEICFEGWLMPVSLSSAFTNWMLSRTLNVLWRPFDNNFRLDLQTGHWEVVDNQVLEHIRNSTVSINGKHSVVQQRSTVQLLHVAHRHNIPISCLHLKESFSKIDAGNVILHSGLRLSCPVSVEKVVIDTRRRREMTETEVVDILMFVQHSHMFKELEFGGCLLPLTFSSESIPAELQSRKIKVSWSNYGYSLNLQSGLWEVDDGDKVKRLCTEGVDINCNDSELLQRCTLKLLENASYHDIPISYLYLNESFSNIDAGDIILHSGLRLSCPVSVKKVVIYAKRGREMTETEVVDILKFVQESHLLEQLEFGGCLLPSISSSEEILAEFKTRDIKVLWKSYGYSLNLQSGAWEVDVDTVKRICTKTVFIASNDSDSIQRCTIQLLEYASDHDIPISCLHLWMSFSKIDAGDVILHSGLRLSCPVSIKKVVIYTERGREMTVTEVVDILMFVQESHMLKELEFEWCLLPQSIPAESIPTRLKSRNVKVTWKIEQCYYNNTYTLNLQSGRWMHSDTRQEITDTKYNDTVRNFRTSWRDTEWQKARVASERK